MTDTVENIPVKLATLRAAALAAAIPSAKIRIDRLKRLRAMIRKHQNAFAAAASADFGCRPVLQTRMEIGASVDSAEYAIKRVARWMRPERITLPLPMRATGARAVVLPQPLGVVGVMSPWNFPFALTLTPLAGILAAGNVALVKPSELTPASAEALADAIREFYAPDELDTVVGGLDVAQAFSAQPFDHMLFTGSPPVAHHVLRAAADHLMPVTLELGGKCPVIVGAGADLAKTVRRVMWGNMQNAGQICLAPDTVFMPAGQEDAFAAEARKVVNGWFPTMRDNPDYTAIVNQKNFERVSGYVEEARAAGVRIETLAPPGERFDQQQHRKIPPTLVFDPPGDLAISREEIFGPPIAVRTYSNLDSVIAYINDRPRPLAIYYFGSDKREQRLLESRTTSGGMTVNDVVMHAAVEELPLGGVGNSGMGAYHGKVGFDTFSHRKSVFSQGRVSLAGLFSPPYKPWMHKLLKKSLGSYGSEEHRRGLLSCTEK